VSLPIGRLDEAAFRQALNNRPDFDLALNALSWLLSMASGHEKYDPREAVALARKAVEVSVVAPSFRTIDLIVDLVRAAGDQAVITELDQIARRAARGALH
jgi:hypothetical protein